MERIEIPVAGLAPIQRHVTTHNAAGESVYIASPPAQRYMKIPGTGGVARSWSVNSVLEDDADMKAYLSDQGATNWDNTAIVMPNGANVLVMDLEPGAVSRMHRTVSIDFSICAAGEIVHELDGGETVLLRPGDHIVQRGTNHQWRNASNSKFARFIGVTLACVPFNVAGKTLQQEFIGGGAPDEK